MRPVRLRSTSIRLVACASWVAICIKTVLDVGSLMPVLIRQQDTVLASLGGTILDALALLVLTSVLCTSTRGDEGLLFVTLGIGLTATVLIALPVFFLWGLDPSTISWSSRLATWLLIGLVFIPLFTAIMAAVAVHLFDRRAETPFFNDFRTAVVCSALILASAALLAVLLERVTAN